MRRQIAPPDVTFNEPEIQNSRTSALEFQDFSRVFQDLCPFPGLSRPGILNNKIPGLSRVCTNPVSNKILRNK